ncbi:MAG: hypothetical protein MZV63_16835 [Marinilabiliales bacterium]|nr:hypothetical protein [Marinilabiliales bacterium]
MGKLATHVLRGDRDRGRPGQREPLSSNGAAAPSGAPSVRPRRLGTPANRATAVPTRIHLSGRRLARPRHVLSDRRLARQRHTGAAAPLRTLPGRPRTRPRLFGTAVPWATAVPFRTRHRSRPAAHWSTTDAPAYTPSAAAATPSGGPGPAPQIRPPIGARRRVCGRLHRRGPGFPAPLPKHEALHHARRGRRLCPAG